jgi:excisionase family DNA binding protein
MNDTTGRTERQSLLSIADVARVLNVSRSTINRLIARGDLPIVKIRDRTLVRPDDLDALIARAAHDRWM